MSRENQKGSVFLFMNKEKQGFQPDYRGTLKVMVDLRAGEELDIAGWKKQDKNGNPYLACNVQDKYKPKTQQSTPTAREEEEPAF